MITKNRAVALGCQLRVREEPLEELDRVRLPRERRPAEQRDDFRHRRKRATDGVDVVLLVFGQAA